LIGALFFSLTANVIPAKTMHLMNYRPSSNGKNRVVRQRWRRSVAEKIILAEKIWNGLSQNSEELTICNNDKKILDRRIDNLEAGKAKTIKWNDLKKKLKAKTRKN
jgi:putative addiction module component (TIGR02574 family)